MGRFFDEYERQKAEREQAARDELAAQKARDESLKAMAKELTADVKLIPQAEDDSVQIEKGAVVVRRNGKLIVEITPQGTHHFRVNGRGVSVTSGLVDESEMRKNVARALAMQLPANDLANFEEITVRDKS